MSQFRVFRSIEEARVSWNPSALAIGNFDGVHVGHQALIQSMQAFAASEHFTPAVLTFDPHPTAVVAPERKPLYVTSLPEKLRLLSEAGVRDVMVLPFTQELSCLAPADFIREIVVDTLQAKGVFVGRDFRFGHKKAGNSDTLDSLAARYAFRNFFQSPVSVRGEIVSSSSIRRYITLGQVSHACRLLGHPFSVVGPVVSGQGIGSKQTVPTLNQKPDPEQVLGRGVFVTETHEPSSGRSWPSITNVGTRPTFDGSELTVETYLLAPLNGSRPEHIRVEFRRFVRPERTFETPDQLRAQIMRDVAHAEAFWRRLRLLNRH